MSQEIKSTKNWTARAIFEFLVIAAIIGVLSFLAYCHMQSMLKNSLAEAVERTTRTIAYELKKQFSLELLYLYDKAKKVENGNLNPAEMVIALDNENSNRVGILSPNGEILFGTLPNEKIFQACEKAFKGEPAIKYLRGVGLIFAVPINLNGEECALFDYHDDTAVKTHFKTLLYNGDGTVILMKDLENWIVLAEGVPPLINAEPGMDKAWETLGNNTGYDPTTDSFIDMADGDAIFYEFNNKGYFVYIAQVSPEHNFGIGGYVPFESVAVGFQTMYTGFLIVVALIILVLVMVARTMVKNVQNKRLQQEKFLALQASKTKSDFLSNMSHEIRTPINAVLGMDEMILREAKDKNILEYAENLKSAGNSLLSIVNDILDFSKIEAGKMEIIPVEYELSSVLNDLVNMIKPRAEKKNLQLIVNANKNLPTVLFGDEIRLKQVITNILTNAVKYTEKGSVTLTADFEERPDNCIALKISVKDTGIGIKAEDIEKLFHAFERIEEKRNRAIEGTGLGMNITKQLLQMMNSKLEVSSVYGEGSEFSFTLLQKVINAEPMGDFTEAFKNSARTEYHEKFTAPNAKILVVDDTAMNLTVIKGLLKQTKIQIDTAESGYECLKLVAKNPYDIIFLDHKMPGMDGIETLQEMKKLADNLNTSTPVISLTANAISGAREQYIAAGFQDYLTKPINSAKLEELIMHYLPPEKVQDAAENSAVEEEINLPDWLKNIDGLNVADGVEHCGGVDSFLDALKVFANSILSGADEIENYFNNEDFKNYTTKVHALKSSARVIGANELSERARRLEDAGNNGYIDEIKNDTAPLLKLYRSYAEKLSPLIEVEENNSDKPPIAADNLAEAFEAMKDATANFDIDTLEFVLQSLEEYQLPPAELERYKKIKAAASKFDWAAIQVLVS